MVTLASTGRETAFVGLGERRVQESVRGIGRLGIDAAGGQTHLGLSEHAFDDNYHAVVEQAARFMVDHCVERAVGFGDDGYDGHSGHIMSHQALLSAVTEVRNTGRDLRHLVINSVHAGAHRVAATPATRDVKLAAMSEHRTQYDTSADGFGSYASEVIVGRHAVESATWEMLRAGGILPLIRDGETYDEL